MEHYKLTFRDGEWGLGMEESVPAWIIPHKVAVMLSEMEPGGCITIETETEETDENCT